MPLSDADIKAKVAEQLPWALDGLAELVRIPSIATDGFPAEPVIAAGKRVEELMRDAGITDIRILNVDGAIGPIIDATVPGPAGSPTVLFYTHYDVVPAGDESLWDSPPFEPTIRDGAMFGRGAADSKSNIISVLAMLRAFDGKPPVTLRILIEGQEEFGGPFEDLPAKDPALFAADAMVIIDAGNVRPGAPTLTTALRGSAWVTVDVRTLDSDKHSGLFGGAAPDARVVLLQALATLHDKNGDVAVAGLEREEWAGIEYDEQEFRDLAGIVDGVPLQGTGGIGSRIWSGPAITVVAFDAPPTSGPINAVASTARAVLNVRVSPQQSAQEGQSIVVEHLRALRPFGVPLNVSAGEFGDGFAADPSGAAAQTMLAALGTAWEGKAGTLAMGGSIPLVMALERAVPTAEKLLIGTADGYASIHGPNERVLLDEFERTIVACALFVRDYAQAAR